MANAEEDLPTDRDVPAPDYLVPGIRCGLEMAIVGLTVMMIGLPTQSPLYLGIVSLAALLAMTVVLFWCLNRHIEEWIRRAQGRPTMTDGGTAPARTLDSVSTAPAKEKHGEGEKHEEESCEQA